MLTGGDVPSRPKSIPDAYIVLHWKFHCEASKVELQSRAVATTTLWRNGTSKRLLHHLGSAVQCKGIASSICRSGAKGVWTMRPSWAPRQTRTLWNWYRRERQACQSPTAGCVDPRQPPTDTICWQQGDQDDNSNRDPEHLARPALRDRPPTERAARAGRNIGDVSISLCHTGDVKEAAAAR